MTVLGMMEAAKSSSCVHRRNPLAKGFWAVCLIVVPILSINPFINIPIIATVWLLAIPAKLAKTFYGTMLKTYPALIGFIVIIWPFFYSGGTHVLFHWGILRVSTEGIVFAIAQGFRIAVAVTGCLFFVMVTDIMDLSSALGAALQKIHVSFTIPLMLISSFKFLPELMSDFSTIKEAFLTRAFELDKGGLLQRIKKFVPLFIPLMDTTLTKAQNIATAMQLKAFGIRKERTFYTKYRFTPADSLIVLLGVAYIVFTVWGNHVVLGGFQV